MLLESIAGFSFLGAFVAFLVAAVVLKFRSIRLTLLLGAAGLLGGWAGMMVYIFLTNGLNNDNAWAVIIPVVFSLLFCYIILKVNKIKIKLYKPKWATERGIAIVLFGFILIVLVYTMIPHSAGTKFSTSDITLRDSILSSGRYDPETLIEFNGRGIYVADQDFGSNGLSINIDKAAVNCPIIAEDPSPGKYIDFKASFAVSNNSWECPYLKVIVFVDNDASGTLSTGDNFWSYSIIKTHLTISGNEGKWKTFLLYGPGGQSEPLYQVNFIPFSGGSYMIMPIFSAVAGQFAYVWNDNGKVFSNTPESYTSPEDQMSLQVDSNGYLHFIEDAIGGFTSVPAGSTVTLTGKIYCPEDLAGKQHGVLVQAFDQRYQADMFDNSATPLASKVKTFTIVGGGPSPPPGAPDLDINFTSWAIVGVLGVVTIAGTAAVISKGPGMIKP